MRPGRPALDGWSILHLLAGIALGHVVGPWWAALGIVVGYEIFEAGLRRMPHKESGLFEFESWPNIFGDIIVGMVGWGIGSLSPFRWIVVPWG